MSLLLLSKFHPPKSFKCVFESKNEKRLFIPVWCDLVGVTDTAGYTTILPKRLHFVIYGRTGEEV